MSHTENVNTHLHPGEKTTKNKMGEVQSYSIEEVISGYTIEQTKDKANKNKSDYTYESKNYMWEQKQVKNALGRPVTRVILDRDNNVILNVGDLITHHSIKEARKAGSLDILLASVYQDQPD